MGLHVTLDGNDYPSHTAQKTATAGWRRFAPESKIRMPEYLPNVA